MLESDPDFANKTEKVQENEFLSWCTKVHSRYTKYLEKVNFVIKQTPSPKEEGKTKILRRIGFLNYCTIKWNFAIVIKCGIDNGEELFDSMNEGHSLSVGVEFIKKPRKKQKFAFKDVPIHSCWLDETEVYNTAAAGGGEIAPRGKGRKEEEDAGLAVCTLIGRPLSYKYVREFVEYHRIVGVDHIFFYYFGDENHFDCFTQHLQYAHEDGFVTIFNLRQILLHESGKEVFPPEMKSPYGQFYNFIVRHDCYHRFKDVFKYTMSLDDDEFLTPVVFDSIHTVIEHQNLNDTALGIRFDGHFVAPIYVQQSSDSLFVDSFVAGQKHVMRDRFVGTPKFILQRNDEMIYVVKYHSAFYSDEDLTPKPSNSIRALEDSNEAIIVHFQSWKAVAAHEFRPIERREEGQSFPYPPMSRFFPKLRRRIAEAPIVEFEDEECRNIYNTDLEEFLWHIQKREEPIDNLKIFDVEKEKLKRDMAFLKQRAAEVEQK